VKVTTKIKNTIIIAMRKGEKKPYTLSHIKREGENKIEQVKATN
jgi:hypothetical protein